MICRRVARSQEVLAAACAALASASAQIMAKKTPLDAHLFHIKHLLILREQIAPFQVDFAVKEMSLDFSSVKSAGKTKPVSDSLFLVPKIETWLALCVCVQPWACSRRRASSFPFRRATRCSSSCWRVRPRCANISKVRRKALCSSFSFSFSFPFVSFRFSSSQRRIDGVADSRRLADRQLKSTCEAFIDFSGDFLVGPIRVFVFKVRVLQFSGKGTLRLERFWNPRPSRT